MVIRFAKNVLLIAVLLGLIACAQQMSRRADGGMTGTGSPLVTIGTVTKFGSVIVNGIEWNSDNARVVVNGKPATTKGLSLGMIVRVEGAREGDSARGVANSIQYESDLVGPMNAASIQRDGGIAKFSVAGQPIYADATTVLDGFAQIAALNDGDQLEISGYRDRFYALHATWIRKNSDGADVVRVKGLVSAVSDRSFKVEGLTVRYPKELDLRASLIKEGTFVAISAKRDATNPMLVTATSLIPIAVAVALPEDTPVIMEGLIKGVTTNGFTMHNRPIKLGDTTTFERGSATDLREDTKVHVIGRFKSGTFAATKVIVAARAR
jgi:Domain of unknown function (DUF5666)